MTGGRGRWNVNFSFCAAAYPGTRSAEWHGGGLWRLITQAGVADIDTQQRSRKAALRCGVALLREYSRVCQLHSAFGRPELLVSSKAGEQVFSFGDHVEEAAVGSARAVRVIC